MSTNTPDPLLVGDKLGREIYDAPEEICKAIEWLLSARDLSGYKPALESLYAIGDLWVGTDGFGMHAMERPDYLPDIQAPAFNVLPDPEGNTVAIDPVETKRPNIEAVLRKVAQAKPLASFWINPELLIRVLEGMPGRTQINVLPEGIISVASREYRPMEDVSPSRFAILMCMKDVGPKAYRPKLPEEVSAKEAPNASPA